MIEVIVREYLLEMLDVPVFMEHQQKLTGEYVLIEKTGGSSKNFLKSATVAIQSYADSMYRASLLNEKVKTAMEQAETVLEIYGTHLNSDYNFTDTETKKYRYQAVFDINYY